MKISTSDAGSVSIEALMDASSRTYISVSVLSALHSMAISVYDVNARDVATILRNGSIRVDNVSDQIANANLVI